MSSVTIEARKSELGDVTPKPVCPDRRAADRADGAHLRPVIAYPLLEAIYLSFFSIYTPTLQGHWVGLDNYRAMLASQEFWNALGTNIVWTVGTLSLQVVFGVAMALLLNHNFFFRSLARSLVLFPYFVSTVVAVLVWRWMFNDLYGILNRAILVSGLSDMPLDWLGSMPNAMISIILVGAWKYFPFVVIAVLARLQTIPEQLYEAATYRWRRSPGRASWTSPCRSCAKC